MQKTYDARMRLYLSNNMIDVTVLSWQLDIHTFLRNNVTVSLSQSRTKFSSCIRATFG